MNLGFSGCVMARYRMKGKIYVAHVHCDKDKKNYFRRDFAMFYEGKSNVTYNIGDFNEWKNIDIIKVVIKTVDSLLGNPEGNSLDLITYITDRLGHDARYAIN